MAKRKRNKNHRNKPKSNPHLKIGSKAQPHTIPPLRGGKEGLQIPPLRGG